MGQDEAGADNARQRAPADGMPHPQVAKYIHFLEIVEADRQQAQRLWALIEPHIDGIIERFYAKLRVSAISAFITDDIVDSLKARQRKHWMRLFSSQFDQDYVFSVQRVGIRHRDINLGAAWYVAGYMALKMDFINAILKAELTAAEKGRLIKMVEKYVALDMTIALSAYEDDSYLVD